MRCSSHLGRAALIVVPRKRHTARLLTDAVDARRAETEAQTWPGSGRVAVKKDFLPSRRAQRRQGSPIKQLIFWQVVRGDSPGPAWLLRLLGRRQGPQQRGPVRGGAPVGRGSSFPARDGSSSGTALGCDLGRVQGKMELHQAAARNGRQVMYPPTLQAAPKYPQFATPGTVALCNLAGIHVGPLGVPLSAPRGRSSQRPVELRCKAQNIKGSDEVGEG
jgi:hypothetical protein